MGTFEYAEVPFNLDTILVARYNINTNTYSGSIGEIAAPQRVEVEPENDEDTLRSSGQKARMISVKVGAKLTLEWGGCDFDVKQICTGAAITSSGAMASGNRGRRFVVPGGGAGFPYFGMICTGFTDDGGLFAAGLPCVKLSSEGSWMLDGNENKFSSGEMGGEALSVMVGVAPNRHRTFDVIYTFERASDYVRPMDAASFLAFYNLPNYG